ncbi:MAG: hypothetical protein QXL15_02145 [Candidatus Korarchaeota archaeon]
MQRISGEIVFIIDYEIFHIEMLRNAMMRVVSLFGGANESQIKAIYDLLTEKYGNEIDPEIFVRAIYYYFVERKKIMESINSASNSFVNEKITKAVDMYKKNIETLKMDSLLIEMFKELSRNVKFVLVGKSTYEKEVEKFTCENDIHFEEVILRPNLINAITEISIKGGIESINKQVLVFFTPDREIIPVAKKMGMLTVYKKKSSDEIVTDSQDRRPHYMMYKLQDFAKIYREVALK